VGADTGDIEGYSQIVGGGEGYAIAVLSHDFDGVADHVEVGFAHLTAEALPFLVGFGVIVIAVFVDVIDHETVGGGDIGDVDLVSLKFAHARDHYAFGNGVGAVGQKVAHIELGQYVRVFCIDPDLSREHTE
ncbi:hypothetical protein, partial [Dysgonomonas sp. HGC4]|uniref:hypothetical protein n=1 Tax=Dysgonomonas sp. HGC4 TaxID=1658009 RepID=UPI00177BE5C3